MPRSLISSSVSGQTRSRSYTEHDHRGAVLLGPRIGGRAGAVEDDEVVTRAWAEGHARPIEELIVAFGDEGQ